MLSKTNARVYFVLYSYGYYTFFIKTYVKKIKQIIYNKTSTIAFMH